MATYDVVFGHNHFTLATTIDMPEETEDSVLVEKAALEQLAEEYGQAFADVVQSSSGITIEALD